MIPNIVTNIATNIAINIVTIIVIFTNYETTESPPHMGSNTKKYLQFDSLHFIAKSCLCRAFGGKQ